MNLKNVVPEPSTGRPPTAPRWIAGSTSAICESWLSTAPAINSDEFNIDTFAGFVPTQPIGYKISVKISN
jgi:hypothetical protein